MIPDPNLLDTVPEEVKEAALTLQRHFGQGDWALFGVCSRSMYERTKAQLDNANDRLAFNSPWAYKTP